MRAEQAVTMASYNTWMNERLFAVCAGIPDAERKRDRKAFFRSIHGTLNHILLADKIWLGRFEGQPFRARGLDQQLHEDFDELRGERVTMDRRIEAWAAGLSDENLAGTFEFESMLRPGRLECDFWVAVAHLFNHQTHHRGQLTALLGQLDMDYGVTDLMLLPGLLSERATQRPPGTERLCVSVAAAFELLDRGEDQAVPGNVKNTTATIIPGLRYSDVANAMEWLCRAFGFEKHLVVPGENGTIAHAQLRFGNGMIMLGSARDDEYGRMIRQPSEIGGAETQAPYVIVDDVDAHWERAKAEGATLVIEPADQPYGGRFYSCRDIEGHLWNFGTYDPWE